MIDDAQHWLVVFCDPEPMDRTTAKRRDRFLYWFLTKFLRPGFRHVYMMRPAHGFDGWVVVNPHSTCIDVMEVTGSRYLELVLQRRNEGHCTVLAAVSRRPETWQVRGALSCVSVVSHVLGTECGIFTTPWRLYRNISQQRATEASAMGGIFLHRNHRIRRRRMRRRRTKRAVRRNKNATI